MLSDEEFDFATTPPEMRKAAKIVEEHLLPTKSRPRYDKAYNCFKEWCTGNKVQNPVSESALLAYFSENAKTKKISTLWSQYSMLRTTLSIREKVDISKHAKLLAFLKKQNKGYKPKKSNTLSMENIESFLEQAPLEFLVQKVF